MKSDKDEPKERRRKMGQGTQFDNMKRVRKEMPPATKVIQPKNKTKRPTNWRDYLDDDDIEGGVE